MTSFFNTVVGGNPFATPVGAKIEQATDASLASENWALNMEICDLINETEEGPRDAIKAIRKRLQTAAGKNYTVVMFTLTVLETCVKNCGKRFHVLVCSKEFVNELVKLIGPKNGPPQAVQEKVLYLIQSWVDAFHRHQEMNGVVQVYQELKIKGVEFPMTDLDAMAPIHTPKKSVGPSGGGTEVDNTMDAPYGRPMSAPALAGGVVAGVGPSETLSALSHDQMTKLRADLDVLQTNMAVFGDMLNELVPGNEHASDIELFQDLHSTLVAMQQRLVELISRLSNDEMTADLLRINDHLNNLFLRYSRYEKNRGAVKDSSGPQPSGPESLIDLTEEAAGGVASVSKKMEAMGIGSQLASLDTVTAQSGPTRPAAALDKDETDFDSFAQSRKVTYSTSNAGSTYEANSRIDHVGGNLGEAFAERAQSGPPSTTTMHKESDFDEMAKWLAEGGLGSTEESLTSSEFDRFLAERAAAAEGLPATATVANPSKSTAGGGGRSGSGDGVTKKQAYSQDGSFYAL